MSEFLASTRAYDVMPDSGKVVVFDTSLPIGLAFFALVEHDTACAPLWDSVKGDYAGTLTTGDMCDIVRMFHAPTPTGASTTVDALRQFTIAAWREYAGSVEGIRRGLSSPELTRAASLQALDAARRAAERVEARADAASHADEEDDALPSGGGHASSASVAGTDDDMGIAGADAAARADPPSRVRRRANRVHTRLISIDPEDDLLTVCARLRAHGIHHMPVLDAEQNAVLSIMSHTTVMTHIVRRFSDSRRMFDQPLEALGVGTFGDIVVVPDNASIISVLNVLAERRISSVPVVSSETGALVDIYSRDDVLFLATDPTLAVLDAPVGLVLRFQVQQTGIARPVVTCDKSDTLHRAMELFAASGCRAERLVCINRLTRQVNGVVSLSDILAYFSSDAHHPVQ